MTFDRTALLALKPVLVAYGLDTFGYSSIGGTSVGGYAPDTLHAFGKWSPASNGTLTTLHWYCTGTSSTPMTLGLYDHDAVNDEPENVVAQTAGFVTSGDGWQSQAASAAITAATTYWFAENLDDDTLTAYYDAGTGVLDRCDDTYSAGNLIDPFGTSTLTRTSRDYSAYGTYTTAGGANAVPAIFRSLRR